MCCNCTWPVALEAWGGHGHGQRRRVVRAVLIVCARPQHAPAGLAERLATRVRALHGDSAPGDDRSRRMRTHDDDSTSIFARSQLQVLPRPGSGLPGKTRAERAEGIQLAAGTAGVVLREALPSPGRRTRLSLPVPPSAQTASLVPALATMRRRPCLSLSSVDISDPDALEMCASHYHRNSRVLRTHALSSQYSCTCPRSPGPGILTGTPAPDAHGPSLDAFPLQRQTGPYISLAGALRRASGEPSGRASFERRPAARWGPGAGRCALQGMRASPSPSQTPGS
ncbi:hypothetical protein C8Q80DRAFT_359270 [Daedaleopsis nitida]|nr:hypothetical protein C8Q80DRAFT_359270 [Daedaleopsis nitida]